MSLYDDQGNWKGGSFGLRHRRYTYASRTSYGLPPVLQQQSGSFSYSSSSVAPFSSSSSSDTAPTTPFLWLKPKNLQPDRDNRLSFWSGVGGAYSSLRSASPPSRPQIIEINERCARFQPGQSTSTALPTTSPYSICLCFKVYEGTPIVCQIGNDVLTASVSGIYLNGTRLSSAYIGASNWNIVAWNASYWISNSSGIQANTVSVDPSPSSLKLGSSSFTGLIREVMVFNSSLSSSALSSVWSYMVGHVELNPLLLGPLLWVDAMSTPLGSVANWTDLSGNNNSFTQATSLNKPTNTANMIGGHQALVGDGVNSFMLSPSIGPIMDWTLFFVGKSISSSGGSDLICPVAYPANVDSYILFEQSGVNWSLNTPPSYSWDPHTGTMPIAAGQAYLMEGSDSSNVLSVYDNAGNSITANASFAGGGIYRNGPMSIFARSDGGAPIHGCLGEIMLLPYRLTTSQKSQLWAYAGRRWSIAVP